VQVNAGRKGGPAPYGMKVTGPGRLAPHPDQAPVVWLIGHLSGQGRGFQAIADQLDALGIPGPAGSKWSRATVLRIVGRLKAERDGQLAATG